VVELMGYLGSNLHYCCGQGPAASFFQVVDAPFGSHPQWKSYRRPSRWSASNGEGRAPLK
jgi:hypothetical protein